MSQKEETFCSRRKSSDPKVAVMLDYKEEDDEPSMNSGGSETIKMMMRDEDLLDMKRETDGQPALRTFRDDGGESIRRILNTD